MALAIMTFERGHTSPAYGPSAGKCTLFLALLELHALPKNRIVLHELELYAGELLLAFPRPDNVARFRRFKSYEIVLRHIFAPEVLEIIYTRLRQMALLEYTRFGKKAKTLVELPLPS